MKALTFLLFSFCIFESTGFAQVVYEKKTDAVKVFSAETNLSKPDTTPTTRSVIHFGWFQPLRGQYPFFYEKGLGSNIGASAGIGFTYADFFRSEHSRILLGNTDGKMKIGFHSELLLKYYFSGLALEDYYIGINAKFSSYNYEKYELGLTEVIQERRYQYVLIAGTQFNEKNNNIVYDYYAGIGIAQMFIDGDELVNTGGSFTPVSTTQALGFKAILRIGVKMGFKLN